MTNFVLNNTLGGNQQSVSSALKTLVDAVGTTGSLRRIYVSQVFMGCDGTLNGTDCNFECDVSFLTGTGGTTAVTPNPKTTLEAGAQSPCLATAHANTFVEGTITANSSRLRRIANQRGFVNWAALTDDDRIQGPALAGQGWAFRIMSPTYNSTALAETVFNE